MGLFKYLYVHHAASHVYIKKRIKKKGGGKFVLSFKSNIKVLSYDFH